MDWVSWICISHISQALCRMLGGVLSCVRFLNPTSGNFDSVDFKLGPGHLKFFFLSKFG